MNTTDLRRHLASLCWGLDKAEQQALVEAYALKIEGTYNAQCPAQAAPQPKQMKLAGRCADGSYIFSRSGHTVRNTSRAAFPDTHYRRNIGLGRVLTHNVRARLISDHRSNHFLFVGNA